MIHSVLSFLPVSINSAYRPLFTNNFKVWVSQYEFLLWEVVINFAIFREMCRVLMFKHTCLRLFLSHCLTYWAQRKTKTGLAFLDFYDPAFLVPLSFMLLWKCLHDLYWNILMYIPWKYYQPEFNYHREIWKIYEQIL